MGKSMVSGWFLFHFRPGSVLVYWAAAFGWPMAPSCCWLAVLPGGVWKVSRWLIKKRGSKSNLIDLYRSIFHWKFEFSVLTSWIVFFSTSNSIWNWYNWYSPYVNQLSKLSSAPSDPWGDHHGKPSLMGWLERNPLGLRHYKFINHCWQLAGRRYQSVLHPQGACLRSIWHYLTI